MYTQVDPVIDHKVRALCTLPYPNHKKGCPNFGKKDGCPPRAPLLGDLIDLIQPVYVIYNRFDFGAHVQMMRDRHPQKSQRQHECCLYWQPKARKQLKTEIAEFRFAFYGKSFEILTCPEANGLNVTETMKSLGINLEWPPEKYTYQVALAGRLK